MPDPENRPFESRERERLEFPLETPHAVEPMQEIPPQEPLFNKKAMLLWALGAFIVWFAVTRGVSVAKETAKAAIEQRVKEAQQKSGGRTITIRRNGEVITITRTPPEGGAAPAAGATPANDAKAATPAAAPTPPSKPEAPAKR